MIRSCVLFLAILGSSAALAAPAIAPMPKALAPAAPGLWEVAGSATGRGAQRVCVRDLRLLGQWEHRGRPCAQKLLSDVGTTAVISYRCPASEFGQSKMTLITPRTLRIETQGIAQSYPFQYTLHARRLGDCPPPR